jgi:hypothetical protein
MDRYTAIIAITSMILGTITLGTFVGAFVYLRTRRKGGIDSGAAARIEERLTHIEQAIDAVAVEVERVSEAQRFTTRLLSERHKEQLGA